METPIPAGVRSIILKESRYRFIGPFKLEGKPQFKKKYIYDPKGRLQLEESNEEKILYQYENDRLVLQNKEDSEGVSLESCRYHYNDQGYCYFKEILVGGDSEPIEVEINREQDGKVIIEKEGKAIRARQYNNKGLLHKEILYTGKDPDSIIQYHYDKQDFLLRIDSKDSTGTLRTSELRTYNDQGILKEQKWEDGHQKMLRHLFYEYPAGNDEHWLVCKVKTTAPGLRRRFKPLYTLHREINYYPQAQPPPVSSLDNSKEENFTEEIPETENQEKTFSNGTYQGPLNDGVMEGKGEFRFNDGSIYIGDFQRNSMEGRGKLTFKDGREYTGEFKNNLMHGQGHLSWPNGDRYQGPFYNGEMHGVGEFIWASGESFKGWFEHNHRSKQGVILPAKDSKKKQEKSHS